MFIGYLGLVSFLISGIVNGQITCNPRTFAPGDYPTLLTDLKVVGSHPLKLRAHSRLVNSTDEITFEGMVLTSSSTSLAQFKASEALAACRSLGCGEVGAAESTMWNQTDTCEYKCADGKKANRKCVFMVDSLVCKDNAMNLVECMTKGFFRYSGTAPYNGGGAYVSYFGVNLICRECGEEK